MTPGPPCARGLCERAGVAIGVRVRPECRSDSKRLQNLSKTAEDSRGIESRDKATHSQRLVTKVARHQLVSKTAGIGFKSRRSRQVALHPFRGLSRQPRAAQHLLEPWVSAQRVEDRVNLHRYEGTRALLARPLQAGERLVRVAHSHMGHRA